MSAKQEQVLRIDPPVELTFTGKIIAFILIILQELLSSPCYQLIMFCVILGPFHQAVSSTMTLTNPSERKVCFKIKTTAPKRYCVKPNSGVIDPREEIKIAGTSALQMKHYATS